MNISWSDIKKMDDYDLIREWAKMKWVIEEDQKAYANIKVQNG